MWACRDVSAETCRDPKWWWNAVTRMQSRAVSPRRGSSQGSRSVAPMHNPNLAPRDAAKQTAAAESGGGSVSASSAAAWHAVPWGLQSRREKSEASQNPEHLQEQAPCPVWQKYLSLLDTVLKTSPNFRACFVQRQAGQFCLPFSGVGSLLCHDGSALLQSSEKSTERS